MISNDHVIIDHVINDWNPLSRKFSNGSDPENEEPRSSKMVQFHHMSAELNFLSR